MLAESTRRPWRLILSLATVTIVALWIFSLLQGAGAAPGMPSLRVLVAARDIGPGETVSSRMVTVESRPQDLLTGLQPALSSDSSYVRRSVTTAPIYAGEVIDMRRLAGPGQISGGSVPFSQQAGGTVRRGYALYTLPTSSLTLSSPGLSSGAYVDVLAELPSTPPWSYDARHGITGTIDMIDSHVMVVSTSQSPPSVTVMVWRHNVPYLAWLIGRHTIFTFSLVRPDDHYTHLPTVARDQFFKRYHADP